jgi:sterol 3beta-glucosyltransferase
MKIGLQTWGTDGDILPFIALANGLVNSGHEVTLAYTSIDGKSYSEAGIRMIEANESIDFNPPPNPYAMGKKPGSFGEYTKLIKYYFDPFSVSMFKASKWLCSENDLVIGHSICHTLSTAAALHTCPRVALALAPMVVRSNMVSPTGESFGALVNSTMWSLGDGVSSRLWFKEGKSIREKNGLPRVKSLQSEIFTSDLLTIVACSPNLVNRPNDWPGSAVLTGFLSPKGEEKEVPRDVQVFLNEGEAPIYMTFGSCMEFQPKHFTNLMIGAALQSGKRAIIQTNIDHPAFNTSENLIRVDQTQHASVFPKCSLIVHHGGAGTTQSALLAGKPSVVIAHGFDQPYWAQQLYNSGVGGRPLLIDSVTESDINLAIQEVLQSSTMAEKAKQVAAGMKKEDSVKRSVQMIEHAMSKLNSNQA